MFPILRPGSIVQIDGSQQKISHVKWQNEHDRPIYFVELRQEFICSWCEVREGHLLAESVYRFKGQSAPAVILTEIDFEALDDRTVRKLFVGMTRARMKLVLVLSERAAALLQGRAQAHGAA